MKDKFKIFLRENGFLLFLFICVCLVAVGTISIVTKEVDKDRLSKGPTGVKEEVRNGEDILSEVIGEDKRGYKAGDKIGEETLDEANDLAKEETAKEEIENQDLVEEVSDIDEGLEEELDFADEIFYESVEAEEVSYNGLAEDMILPVAGEIMTEYAKDKLIYSKTLDEWRGHSGIDIRAKLGTNILAALSGKVIEVYEDSLWGNTIVIDHGQGLKTKYSNLATLEMVREGIRVTQGDYISTIGNTAKIEQLMDEHLHFEVIKDKKTVDPRSIIR